jgi:hypothetical protein
MNAGNEAVRQIVIVPVSISTTSTANVIDTAGFDYAEFEIVLGAVGSAFTALKLQESDVKGSGTTLTSGTDVPGSIFHTSYSWDLAGNAPIAAGGAAAGVTATSVYPETQQYPLSHFPTTTDASSIQVINVDLKGRKRYLLLVATAGSTTLISATCRLTRAQMSPWVPSQMVPLLAGSAAVGQVLQVPPIYPNSSGT